MSDYLPPPVANLAGKPVPGPPMSNVIYSSAKCNRYNALIEVTSPVQVAIVLSIAGAGAYFFVKYLNSSDKERKQRKPTHPKVGITIIKEKKLKKKSKKEPEPGIPVGKPVED